MKATKEELKLRSADQQAAIEAEFKEIKKKSLELARVAAVVGTGFFITYFIIKGLTGKKGHSKDTDDNGTVYAANVNKTKVKKPSFLRTLSGIIMTEATVFLVGIVKDQVTSYLKNPLSHERKPA